MEKQLMQTEGVEYFAGDSTMLFDRSGEDKDVIHVADGLIAVNKGVEDVVHHGLEGGR